MRSKREAVVLWTFPCNAVRWDEYLVEGEGVKRRSSGDGMGRRGERQAEARAGSLFSPLLLCLGQRRLPARMDTSLLSLSTWLPHTAQKLPSACSDVFLYRSYRSPPRIESWSFMSDGILSACDASNTGSGSASFFLND